MKENKRDIIMGIIFYVCTVLFFINLIYLLLIMEHVDLIYKIIISILFGLIFGYMIGYRRRQKLASKEIIELSEAMENYYTQKPADLELGNLAFNPNTNQRYECSKEIIDALKQLRTELNFYMMDKEKWYENPFDNTGNTFKNKVFEVQVYNWNDELSQDYNFKWKDIQISWYKYLGRDTTINKPMDTEQIQQMYKECVDSLKMNKRKTHHNKK